MDYAFLFLFLSFFILLAIAYTRQKHLHVEKGPTSPLALAAFFILGSFSTYTLQQNLHFNTVLSAGLVGFIGSYSPKFLPKINYKKEIPIAIYCGAFVGMSTVDYGYSFLLFATLLTTLIFTYTQHLFHGIGGKLGTIAFMGVLYTYIIYYFFTQWL